MALESTGTTDFAVGTPPDAIGFWMKLKDDEPPKPVRIIVTAGALEDIDRLEVQDWCEFRRNPAGDSDLMSAAVDEPRGANADIGN